MAFRLDVTLGSVEYRGMRTGKSTKTGNPWMSLVLEDSDANQIEVSVPQDMQGDVYGVGLRKGDMLALGIRAVAMSDGNSYIRLTALPQILESEEVDF